MRRIRAFPETYFSKALSPVRAKPQQLLEQCVGGRSDGLKNFTNIM